MRNPVLAVLLLAVLTMFASAPAFAHKMRIFAWVETGDANREQIAGEVYFVGGNKTANAEVVLVANDKPIATTLSDENGEFIFTDVAASDYQVIADAKDGHIADFAVSQDEFSAAVTVPVTVVQESEFTEPVTVNDKSPQDLEKQIANAVKQAVRPLRAELNAYQDKRNLQDIIGAIGYIFGLFGLWALLSGRNRKADQGAKR